MRGGLLGVVEVSSIATWRSLTKPARSSATHDRVVPPVGHVGGSLFELVETSDERVHGSQAEIPGRQREQAIGGLELVGDGELQKQVGASGLDTDEKEVRRLADLPRHRSRRLPGLVPKHARGPFQGSLEDRSEPFEIPHGELPRQDRLALDPKLEPPWLGGLPHDPRLHADTLGPDSDTHTRGAPTANSARRRSARLAAPAVARLEDHGVAVMGPDEAPPLVHPSASRM